MAKKVEYWMCGKCDEQHDTEEKAVECENNHPVATDFDIVGYSYSVKGKYGPGRGLAQLWPTKIKIRNQVITAKDPKGGWGYDWAIYELVQIGPKGL